MLTLPHDYIIEEIYAIISASDAADMLQKFQMQKHEAIYYHAEAPKRPPPLFRRFWQAPRFFSLSLLR